MANERDQLARLAGGELRELLRLLDGSDIEELELDLSGTRLYFKREPGAAVVSAATVAEEAALAAAATEAAFVVAERVGFFHHAGDGAGALKLGDRVLTGQVLGAIDSMNVPVPVPAPRAGRIEEILVEEGQPVEYGQPLFVIEPNDD